MIIVDTESQYQTHSYFCYFVSSTTINGTSETYMESPN